MEDSAILPPGSGCFGDLPGDGIYPRPPIFERLRQLRLLGGLLYCKAAARLSLSLLVSAVSLCSSIFRRSLRWGRPFCCRNTLATSAVRNFGSRNGPTKTRAAPQTLPYVDLAKLFLSLRESLCIFLRNRREVNVLQFHLFPMSPAGSDTSTLVVCGWCVCLTVRVPSRCT